MLFRSKTAKAKVTKATVFLSGAEVTCSAAFQASPGINEFVFEGVSPTLDVNSLQSSAQGNIVLMDVKCETRFNTLPKKDAPKQYEKAIKAINDSLVGLNFDIEDLTNQTDALNTERTILLNNRLMKGETHRDTLALFKESIEFLRQRLNNINAETLRIKKELYYKNTIKQNLQTRLAVLNKIDENGEQPEQEAVYTIIVTASADEATAANVSVTFFESNAAWLPSYDLRANQNGTIDLNYKAEVRQRTGMDWNNVALILSTGNPSQSTQRPELNPFYLNFVSQYRNKFKTLEKVGVPVTAGATTRENYSSVNKDEDLLDAKTVADYVTVTEGMIQTEYDIRLKYNMPNDDNMHLVSIQNKSLKANYKYEVVPKLDVNAYLMAELTDWSEMNLIPGNARVYFDNSFIGRTMLNPTADADTLVLSLGRDRSILVNRKKLKDKTHEKVLLDEKQITCTYEITVRNQKAVPISIEVIDQMPLSNNQLIKVEPTDTGNANHDADTGKLVWKLNVKSKESRKVQFAYEVKLPKDKSLAGL